MGDHGNQSIPTACCHDCGGRCPYIVHVEEGKARKVEPYPDPALRPCVKVYAFPQKVHAEDRLLFPLKRTGARGDGKFNRISWEEALREVATQLKRVRDTYGASSILGLTANGAVGYLHSPLVLWRLLNMVGGFTNRWGSASNQAAHWASLVNYGTVGTGNSHDDLVNSRLIILWGWNALETMYGTGTPYYLVKAKEAGAKIIYVDVRFTNTAAVLANQWIPIRPGTDTAMLLSMAYVMIREKLLDEDFLKTYTVGFEYFSNYVLGKEDGITKTPLWAEGITGVKADTIEALAREYSTTKPAALMPAYSIGRTSFGAQPFRAAMTLAAMTGSIGISGGNAAGVGSRPGTSGTLGGPGSFPVGESPSEPVLPGGIKPLVVDHSLHKQYRIHTAMVWDAMLTGKAGGYPADIKMVYIACTDCLNQWSNTNKAAEAIKKPEFVVIHEQFMTPTARFADVILPVNSHWERNDCFRGLDYTAYGNKIIEPLGETKSDFEICCELAEKLGIEGYSDKSEDEWIRNVVPEPRDRAGNILSYDEFQKQGIAFTPIREQPIIAFKEQITDLKPFPTPSGKIEIYSEQLVRMGNPDLPPIPKYIPTWENIDDPLAQKYPFQLVTFHPPRRVHSVFYNIPAINKLEPSVVWINSRDASMKNIRNGDKVKVFNDRGATVLMATVTERIIPGVVAIAEGAWYIPDEHGVDHGGNPNVLTKDAPTPCGGIPYNTVLVQIERS